MRSYHSYNSVIHSFHYRYVLPPFLKRGITYLKWIPDCVLTSMNSIEGNNCFIIHDSLCLAKIKFPSRVFSIEYLTTIFFLSISLQGRRDSQCTFNTMQRSTNASFTSRNLIQPFQYRVFRSL